MIRLYILTLISTLLALALFFFRKRTPATIAAGEGLLVKKEWLVTNPHPVTPEKDCRPADQTFLTFPEWYLVFSPEEQAAYFKQQTASSFPFMKHTAQIWQSYRIVNAQIKDNFPVNRGYHFMIWVIGFSASVEYSIKALYETSIGRLTDTKEIRTAEDRFNAVYTQAYVDFIKDRPWYEFDFQSRLKYLWKEVPYTGTHLLRKIERRYILSSELLVKWGYGKLIGLGTKTVYDVALPTTAVLIDALPEDDTSLQIIQKYHDNSALVYLPRYDKFNAAAIDIATKGIGFKEIAGNNSAILLTVLLPANSVFMAAKAQLVFTQPIASNKSLKRLALAVPVAGLSPLLRQLVQEHIQVEHIFDY